MSRAPRVACVGAYILDVLGRPVNALPTVQQALLIEEIRMTVAGTAGGTAVDLARLGLDVLAVGAVGDDNAGEFMLTLLAREGVDTSGMSVKARTATSASMLPISSRGVRPAWHVRGANLELARDDIPWSELTSLAALHYGGVSALPGLDGEVSRDLLATARSQGAITTADCLGIKRPDAMEVFRGTLPYIDVFMPNGDELARLTGLDSPRDGARMLIDCGASAVIVKLDAAGCYGISGDREFSLPALDVAVVDSTGCGDAFCAGVIRGLTLGWDIERAAQLGTACGALTTRGLGSDAGIRDLGSTLAYLAACTAMLSGAAQR